MRRRLITWKITRARMRDEKGFSLVEVVIILVIMGIAILPLSRLAIRNLKSQGDYALMTRGIFYAQEWIEQVIADYAATNDGRGYDWVRSNWAAGSDTPESGCSRTVTISGEHTLNGVNYVTVEVTVSGSEFNDIILSTWLVDND